MSTLKLYTRPDCHLCELAQALMAEVGLMDFQVVDIDLDLELISQYGGRIPVLADTVTGTSLDWPFTLEDLKVFQDNKQS